MTMTISDTASGVPPMGIFGDGYRYHVTVLVHDVRGYPTERPDEIVPFLNRMIMIPVAGFVVCLTATGTKNGKY